MSKQPRILLMDEDAEILEQLQTALRREGYQVFVAADGHAALQKARNIRPDLIVSELLLVGLDGYEVWKLLRADKENATIPILVISALTVPPCNEPWRPNPNAEWQLLSYDAFLPKPIDLRRFIRVVQKLLAPDQAHTIPAGPSAMIAIEDKKFQHELATILSEHDFGVETPPSLNEALKLVKAMAPAALLLDYRVANEAVKNIALQTKKFVPNTVIILITDPNQQIDIELETLCDGSLTVPLHPTLIALTINRILDYFSVRRRTKVLSTQLIGTNRDLLDAQQVLQAQNEELQHINAQLRELGSLKETLTSMVVHDLKAPLGSVLGALNFLLTEPNLKLSEVSESLLTGAVAAGNQMLRLVETLLEGQRLEDGYLKPDQEPFELSTLVDVSLHQVLPLLTLHQLKVQRVIPGDLPLAYADPYISQRILENLLDNAIKFSPRDTVITIKASLDNHFIKVSVQDQGPGIPKDYQTEIFNQFAQLKNAAAPATRAGFGLGLTFCNLATQAMGGSIWVESDGESGTTFLFTLPIFSED